MLTFLLANGLTQFDISDDALSQRRKKANAILNEVGALQSLNMVLYMLLDRLNKVERRANTNEFQLEHDLRLTLNMLINFMIYNNDDPSVAREFTNS